MNRSLFLSAIAFLTATWAQAAPIVSDVRSAQIPGTHKVKITYLLESASPCTIAVLYSNDGGAYTALPPNVPAIAAEPAIVVLDGELVNVAGGTTPKSLTLDATKVPALAKVFTKQLRFKIEATDAVNPPTYGDLVRIDNAGSFQMGDQSSPLVGYSDELPVHTVTVSTFYMAKYETSWLEWKQVRDWARASGLGYTDLPDGAGKADDHPVHTINWYAMVKWCNARSEKENLVPCYTVSGAVYRAGSSAAVVCNWSANGYRLPSEAEWEKAARGRLSGQNFPWGNRISQSLANYYGSPTIYTDDDGPAGYNSIGSIGGYPYTAPVNSFTANGYGLFNMSGNVWEWCWDWYGYYTAGSQTDPHGAVSGSSRVFRGGSWVNLANSCRVAYRYTYGDPGRNNIIGFRVARSSVP